MSKYLKLYKRVSLRTYVSVLLIFILLPIVLITLFRPSQSQAVWYDDAYAYRQTFTFTHNADISSERAITLSLDTAELISAGVMQSDCDDTRFTDANGKLLRYQLTGTCNNASTTYEVVFPIVINGSNTGYIYYGNPGAHTASVNVSGITALTPSGGDPAITDRTSETKGTAPVLYWAMDEGTDNTCIGGTNDACDSSSSGNNATGRSLTWKNEEFCVSGKCFYVNGADEGGNSSSAGSMIYTETFTNLSPQTAGAISFWAKVTKTNDNQALFSFSNNTSATLTELNMFYDNRTSGGSNFQVDMSVDGTMQWSFTVSSSVFNTRTETNRWHHYTLVHNGTTPTMYIDGKAVDITFTTQTDKTDWLKSILSDATSDATRLSIGHNVSNSTIFNTAQGYFDEFKIYPSALSASQVKAGFIGFGASEGAAVVFGTNNNKFLSDGLVGYWPMDESNADSCTGGTNDTCDKSGNGLDGAWTNTTVATTAKYGRATDYDGTNDSTAVSDSDLLSINTTNKFTVSAWLYPDSNSSTQNVISKGTTSNFEWSLGANTTQAQALIWNSSGSIIGSATASSSFNTGSWQHFAFTADLSTNVITLYKNGAIVGTGTISGTYTNGTASLRFGERADGSNDYDGKIDEVRIYNRTLSEKEVFAIYTKAPGPVGYWKLDEKTGTSSTSDASGNSYTGTLTNIESDDWTSGKFGAGLKLDGSNENVIMGDNLDFERTEAFTLATWFRTTVDGNQSLIAKQDDNAGGAEGYNLQLSSGGLIHFQVVNTYLTNYIEVASSSDLNYDDGQWHHVAATYDGSVAASGVKLYFDGVQIADTDNGNNLSATTVNASNLQLGARDSTEQYFNGSIDDSKIYNYARTPSQITEDMNAGHPLGGSPISSQVGYWALDELYGSTANNQNSAQSSLTGSISGAAWKTKENCKISGCLDFDGSDDVGTVTNANAIDFDINLNSGFTFSTWINPDTVGEGSAGQIFVKNTSTYCQLGGSTPFNITCSVNQSTDATATANSVIPSGSWTHVALSYSNDDDDELTIYVNGRAIGSSTNGVGPLDSDSSNLLIGGGTSNNFDGRIDEFKVYSTGLTPQEVAIDMNANAVNNFGVGSDEANKLTDGAGNPPVGHWNFDEKTGTSVQDRSGNGRTATITDGGGTTGDWTSGKVGSSYNMRGNNDADNIGISDVSLGTSNTISFWVSFYDLGGSAGANDAVVGGDGGGSTEGYMFYTDGTNIYSRQALSSAVSVAATFTNDVWYHITVVRSGTSVTFYRNGVQVGTTQTYGSNNSFTLRTLTNVELGTTGFPLEGKIDEVKVYDYARTTAQVAYDYNRGRPVGWWNFDEGVNNRCSGGTNDACDSSGNGYDGAFTGSMTRAAGKRNEAITFDGSTTYVEVSDNTAFEFPNSTATFTLTAWVKLNGTEDVIFGKYNGSSDQREWFWDISANKNRITLYEDGTSTNFYRVNGTTNITADTWTHIAWVVDIGADTVKSYINGKEESVTTSGTVITTLFNGTASLFFGALATSPSSNGSIDEAMIYRYALSESQLKQIVNENAVARFGPTEGLP